MPGTHVANVDQGSDVLITPKWEGAKEASSSDSECVQCFLGSM